MEEDQNILVFGECEGEALSAMSLQLLGIGGEIASALGEELHLLLLGPDAEKGAEEGCFYGADKVCVGNDPVLEFYMTETYLQAMEQVMEVEKPGIVLFGQNDKGMDLAPRLAFRLKTGVTLDCVDLQVDEESKALRQVKPVFGGKAECHYYAKKGNPVIATVRDRTFEPAVYDGTRTGEIVNINLLLDASKVRTRFLEKEKDASQSLANNLLSARTVVSGGRGLGAKEGFDILNSTAEILGGTVAGSRPTVDYGWVPNALQVGLTGQKIAPELYFAIGISGAIQHMAGCLKSKTIVSINTDEEASIFQFSHYGVVGDYKDVLLGFNNECMKIRDKQ